MFDDAKMFFSFFMFQTTDYMTTWLHVKLRVFYIVASMPRSLAAIIF